MPSWINAILASGVIAGAAAAQQPQAPAQENPDWADWGPTGDDTATYAIPDTMMAFTGTTVIDIKTGELQAGQTIVVVGRRIQAVGPAARVRVPAGAKTIRADGTFVIPGLWDMHTHLLRQARHLYPLLIANGITGIQEMSTNALDSTLHWRREIAAGRLVGPRILTPGPAIDAMVDDTATTPTKNDPDFFHVHANSTAYVRRIVDSLKAAGVDFLKPYGLDRPSALAMAEEAKKVGLPLAGHKMLESAAESSELGQRSIEHGFFCHDSSAAPQDVAQQPEDCATVAAVFRKHGTWLGWNPIADVVIPMHLAGCEINCHRYYASRDTIEPPVMVSCGELCSLDRWAQAHGPEYKELFESTIQKFRAGIRMVLGTDGPISGAGNNVGSPIHDTMWSFVTAGLPPLAVLQMATWNPAEYLGATDSLGSVTSGKLADFVFLDANPLVDMYNTRRIRAVVANGRLFERGALDRMLIDTEARATRTRAAYREARRGR